MTWPVIPAYLASGASPCWDRCMENGEPLDGSHWIWSTFSEHNERHFGGRLPRPAEIWRFADSRQDGELATRTVNGVTSYIIGIDGTNLDGDAATASDSLLHEMVHFALLLTDGDADAEHGARFRARADEIGTKLGLQPCSFPGFTPEQLSRIAISWPVVQRAAQLEMRAITKAERKRQEEKKRWERDKKKAERRARR